MSLPTLIAAGALLMVFIGVLVVRWRRAPRLRVPSCARCRYDVTGLPSDICPECGADLNEVGILEPGQRRPMALLTRLVLMTCVIAAAAIVAAPHIDAQIPLLRTFSTSIKLSSPHSGLYDRIEISGVHSSRELVVLGVDDLTVNLVHLSGARPQPATPLEVDRAQAQVAFDGPDGQRVTLNLDAAAIMQWFAANGVNTAAPELAYEADVVVETLQNNEYFQNPMAQGAVQWTASGMSTGSFGPIRNMMSRMSIDPAPDPWRLLLVWGPFGAVWLLGLLLLLLTNRNPERIAALQPPAATLAVSRPAP